jgi:hypothetical protein
MSTYFALDRRFVKRTKYEPHELAVSDVMGKRVKWPQVLEHRFVIVVAPANYGKTTEMLEQVNFTTFAAGSFVALYCGACPGH